MQSLLSMLYRREAAHKIYSLVRLLHAPLQLNGGLWTCRCCMASLATRSTWIEQTVYVEVYPELRCRSLYGGKTDGVRGCEDLLRLTSAAQGTYRKKESQDGFCRIESGLTRVLRHKGSAAGYVCP